MGIDLHAGRALLPDGWATGVRLRLGADGRIAAVEAGVAPAPADRRVGILVPGVPNLHSHAFQRAMAGLVEVAGPGADSFWTWRTLMYRFVARLTPDQVGAIAALLYAEMLEAGFTSVAEFHYVHHAPDGTPYADPAEIGGRLIEAAAEAGIALTLLPVLYQQNGFGDAPPSPGQRRFVCATDRFLDLVDRTRAHAARRPGTVVGIAPHSLRAVPPDALAAAVAATPDGPIHIHIAEQRAEVAECEAWSGQRSVEWLLAHHALSPRWCLVHATHVTDAETRGIAARGAVAGLCPITEANLGDGLFPLRTFLDAGGALGVGSDSNVEITAAGELRLLEYGQRLVKQARNVIAAPGASTGRTLLDAALRGGALALGRPAPALAAGAPADLVALDPDHPALVAHDGDAALDGWIFAAGNGAVTDVWAAGRPVVAAGRHVARDALRRRYAAVLREILADA